MRKSYWAAACAMAFMLILPSVTPAVRAQSTRYQAKKWFNLSLREKNLEKKINLLAKALRYDSLFTDALHQMGQSYLQESDYTLAEFYLIKACRSLDSTATARKAQILYELAITCQILGKPGEAEAALREAKMLARDQKQRIFLTFELGRHLFHQNRYQEAWEQLINEMESRDDSVQWAARKIRVGEMQAMYARAQRHWANQELEKAVIAYDSLLQHAGAFAVAARVVRADTSSPAWPLSAAIKPDERENRLGYIGGVVALVFLPLLGFAAFSPALRIAFHKWRKNHLAAAKAFEKLLERNPQKINFYAPLAELYLQLGRCDERALKIYKTVLQLNLRTPKRDEINTILAQKYLAEGRTDSDVIEVLENALKTENRRQNLALKATN